MALLKFDPNEAGGQYLEDLATAYWYSDALFTALDSGLFDALEAAGSADVAALAAALGHDPEALARFLFLLQEMGLTAVWKQTWSNTALASRFLVRTSPDFAGGNIRWRRDLQAHWRSLPQVLAAGRRTHFPPQDMPEEEMAARRDDYLAAMDAVLMPKLSEITALLGEAVPEDARILDVGAGSGLFAASLLTVRPQARATLMDIRQILPHTEKRMASYPEDLRRRVACADQNILERPWQAEGPFDTVILSNIAHAYGPGETENVLIEAAGRLSDRGLLIIHDFFLEHWPLKSRLSDINMMVNTYNGRAYAGSRVREILEGAGLTATGLVPLKTDTALIFAAKDPAVLKKLRLDDIRRLMPEIKALGFADVLPFDPREVVLAPFAKEKCRFGCRSYARKECAENADFPLEKTRQLLTECTSALLLRGEPPTGDFQRRCLAAEALAFKAGFYKAFVFWAGPCSICPQCDPQAPCANSSRHRPSMEGSGMDVFATVQAAGETLKTLKTRGEVVKYYALLLLQ